jgi:hypothetical protein
MLHRYKWLRKLSSHGLKYLVSVLSDPNDTCVPLYFC